MTRRDSNNHQECDWTVSDDGKPQSLHHKPAVQPVAGFTVLLPKRRPRQLAASPIYESQYLLFLWMWHRAACSVVLAADRCALGKIIQQDCFSKPFFPPFQITVKIGTHNFFLRLNKTAREDLIGHIFYFLSVERVGRWAFFLMNYSDMGWPRIRSADCSSFHVIQLRHHLSTYYWHINSLSFNTN